MVYQTRRDGRLRSGNRAAFRLYFVYSDDTLQDRNEERRILHLCEGVGTKNRIVHMIYYKDGSFKNGFVQVVSTRGNQNDNKYHELSADGTQFLKYGPRSTTALRRLLESRGINISNNGPLVNCLLNV